MTSAIEHPRTSLWILLWVGMVLWSIVWAPNAHSIERHGTLAEKTMNCMNGAGKHIASFFNPETKRVAEMCADQDGKFYVLVFEVVAGAISVVTAFCKDKMKRPGQVKNYLSNVGYRGGRNIE